MFLENVTSAWRKRAYGIKFIPHRAYTSEIHKYGVNPLLSQTNLKVELKYSETVNFVKSLLEVFRNEVYTGRVYDSSPQILRYHVSLSKQKSRHYTCPKYGEIGVIVLFTAGATIKLSLFLARSGTCIVLLQNSYVSGLVNFSKIKEVLGVFEWWSNKWMVMFNDLQIRCRIIYMICSCNILLSISKNNFIRQGHGKTR